MAARALAAALLPATLREDAGSTVFGRGGRGVRLLGDLMEHLTSHPSYPILSLYTVPQVRSAECHSFHPSHLFCPMSNWGWGAAQLLV